MIKVMYAWASGLIEIDDECPEGAIAIAEGTPEALEYSLIFARRGYDGEYIVPGIPEAKEGSDEAVDALIRFQYEIKKRIKAYADMVFHTKEERFVLDYFLYKYPKNKTFRQILEMLDVGHEDMGVCNMFSGQENLGTLMICLLSHIKRYELDKFV